MKTVLVNPYIVLISLKWNLFMLWVRSERKNFKHQSHKAHYKVSWFAFRYLIKMLKNLSLISALKPTYACWHAQKLHVRKSVCLSLSTTTKDERWSWVILTAKLDFFCSHQTKIEEKRNNIKLGWERSEYPFQLYISYFYLNKITWKNDINKLCNKTTKQNLELY